MSSKSDHELVPVHELMSDKEVESLLSKLNITLNNLPKILESDPQSVKLGARPGQVIRIFRKDGKSEYEYYRRVVEG